MGNQSFDYVIIGGGTAGCVLAHHLSRDPSTSVLVLEAGPEHRGLYIHMPAAIGTLYEQGRYHWPYQSAPEPEVENRSFPYKMGCILGGSSAINGLMWVRGNPLDYDDWAQMGCPGWSYRDVEPIFRRIEAIEGKDEGGPIPVSLGTPEDQPLSRAFFNACRQAAHPFNEDCNGPVQEGICRLPRNIGRGRRGDVYQGYIAPIRGRKNLTFRTGITVERLSLDGTRVTGAVLSDGETITARRETLLCAGALASPQLLELSGIGQPDVLAAAGIPLRHVLPGVGENLHTHPALRLTYRCPKPLSLAWHTRGIGRILTGVQWIITRKGIAASNQFEAGAILKTDPTLDRPDIILTFLPLAMETTTRPREGHGFQIYIELVGARSRGASHIASRDPKAQPQFRMNYLTDPADLQACITAIRMVRNIVGQPAFEGLRGAEIEPGDVIQSDEEIESYVRRSLSISHHLVGTCRMGQDERAVVNPALRLHGLSGLRIVDASIMPKVTSANTHAATVLIAEKAAEMILESREA